MTETPNTENEGTGGPSELSAVLGRFQYYYKRDECNALTAADANCCCWHDEGTGPYYDERHDDSAPLVEWRIKPTPNVEFSVGAPLHGAASAGTQG